MKTKKQPYKKNKENVLKNAEASYNWLKIIVNLFEKQIFEYGCRPRIDVDYETSSDIYDLGHKELQMFKKLFKYDNPNELRDTLMNADEEEYYELKNDLKIKQTVLNDQIRIKIGVERTRLENLINAVENVLDHVIGWRDDDLIDVERPDLEGEESAAQRRNQRD